MEKNIRKKLASSRLFRNLDWEEANRVFNLNIGAVKKFKKGEIIVSPDEPFDYLGVIVSGELEVLRILENGEQYHINFLKENNLIGIEDVALGMNLNFYFYIAKTDVGIYLIPESCVMRAGQIPERIRQKLVKTILQILVHENYRLRQKLDILSVGSMRDRIYRFLSHEQFKKKTKVFEIPYNREQMADYLGVNRSALSRELSHMEKDGIIKYDKNRFELL